MVCPMRFVLLGVSAVLALVAVTWCNASSAEGPISEQPRSNSKVRRAGGRCY